MSSEETEAGLLRNFVFRGPCKCYPDRESGARLAVCSVPRKPGVTPKQVCPAMRQDAFHRNESSSKLDYWRSCGSLCKQRQTWLYLQSSVTFWKCSLGEFEISYSKLVCDVLFSLRYWACWRCTSFCVEWRTFQRKVNIWGRDEQKVFIMPNPLVVQDAFLLELPSLVNDYSLESHIFKVYKKTHSFTVFLERSLEKMFSAKAKTPHVVQAEPGCYVYSALPVQTLLSKTLLNQNEDLFRPHSNFEWSKSCETNQSRKWVKISWIFG